MTTVELSLNNCIVRDNADKYNHSNPVIIQKSVETGFALTGGGDSYQRLGCNHIMRDNADKNHHTNPVIIQKSVETGFALPVAN